MSLKLLENSLSTACNETKAKFLITFCFYVVVAEKIAQKGRRKVEEKKEWACIV